jgi:hypothetical protein
MQDGNDDSNGKPDSHYTFQRWLTAAQNDFAARADWCVKSYKEANHPPVVKLRGVPDRNAKPGTKIKLNASGTKDPDGDKLTYRWWQYTEADSYPGTVSIRNADSRKTSFTVPADASKGETIHIICDKRQRYAAIDRVHSG